MSNCGSSNTKRGVAGLLKGQNYRLKTKILDFKLFSLLAEGPVVARGKINFEKINKNLKKKFRIF